jgi:ribosome-associated protein
MPATDKHLVQQLLAAAAAACEDKKAEDIRILSLDPTESGLTDYFLICTGMSDRQNVAITDEIEIRLKREFGTYPTSVEGRRQGEWILMDYVDFIVHVFSAEKRAFYNLERLRKTATVLSIEDLNTHLKSKIKAVITAGRTKTSSVTKISSVKRSTSSLTAAKKAPATKKRAAEKAPTAAGKIPRKKQTMPADASTQSKRAASTGKPSK